MKSIQIELFENKFHLLPQRAVYWEEQSALILSDLHIGKGMHFRKEGIPVPRQAFTTDLETLNDLISGLRPEKLIVVGDMFHSHHNNEVVVFDIWRAQYEKLHIKLVRGNHDILSAKHFKEMDIDVVDDLVIGDFIFSHDKCHHTKKFCFSGHLHPGIRLQGRARQTIKLPCFHFTPQFCTLPAFSKFTGLALIEPKAEDEVYIVFEEEVMQVIKE